MRVPIRLSAPSKYRSQRTSGYSSKKEADYAKKLQLWAKLGEIQNLEEQVRFEILPKDALGPAVHYIADFRYTDKYGEHVVDVKGFRTREYKLKKRLLYRVSGIVIEEI